VLDIISTRRNAWKTHFIIMILFNRLDLSYLFKDKKTITFKMPVFMKFVYFVLYSTT
jgi:hypothetical protein